MAYGLLAGMGRCDGPIYPMVSRGRPNGSARPCRQRLGPIAGLRWRRRDRQRFAHRHATPEWPLRRRAGCDRRPDGDRGGGGALWTAATDLGSGGFVRRGGSRFPTANFWGSRATTGAIASSDADKTVGCDDQTMSDAMRAVGLQPERIGEATRHDIESFIELHIEQGPVLEHANLPVAVVTGITGLRHYDAELTGVANHAGAFPMDLRRDPTAGFAEIVTTLIGAAERIGRPRSRQSGGSLSNRTAPRSFPVRLASLSTRATRTSPLIATFAQRTRRHARDRAATRTWHRLSDHR